jgi:hypothetical protein
VVAAYLELRPLAPLVGDPRLGMAGIFLQLSRVLPHEYPVRDSVSSYLNDELIVQVAQCALPPERR